MIRKGRRSILDFWMMLVSLRKKAYTKLRKQFRESYMNSLNRIGFNYFDYTSINGFYDILFATSNPKGIEFWKKATKVIDSSGQRTLDFGL